MSKHFALVVAFILFSGSAGKAAADESPDSHVQQATQPEALDVAAIVKRLKEGDPEGRLESLNQLRLAEIDKLSGNLKMDAIEQCARLMQSRDNDVASRACDVLSRFDSDAVPLLIEALQSKDAVLQTRAARALGSIASRHESQLPKIDAAIPHLTKLLNGGAKNARHNSFYAISAMGPGAIPHMINALDAEEYFQQVMLKGFVRHGEKSVEPLCEALRTGDTATRRSAASMLFFISWQAPDVLPVLESKALGPLTSAIEDDDQLVRSRVIETLGRMKGRAKPSLDKIIAALKQPDPPFLSIADAAHRIGPEVRHIDDLLNGVRKVPPESVETQERAAWQFGEAISTVGEEGVERVVEALDDRDKAVRKTAMVALYRLGPDAAVAVPAIIRQLNEGDRLAPEILTAIGPQAADAIPDLIGRLAHDDWFRPRISLPKHHPQHFSKCADALTAIGPDAVPALLEGLKHKNDLVRAGCLVGLGNMDANAMVPVAAIVRLCHDKHRAVRDLAFLAMIQQAGDDKGDAIDTLRQLREGPHPEVVEAAIYHLERLKKSNE